MNRRHNANQAFEVVENAAKTGFKDISVDLIYGLPGLKPEQWQDDLNKVFELPVTSSFCLSFNLPRRNSVLHLVKKRNIKSTK